MKHKTVAIVSDAVFPFNKGGKEKRLHDITTRLVAEGYDVTIYCMKWWKGKEKSVVEDGVKLYAISPYYPLYAGNRRSIKQAIFFALNCLKLITKKFDIIDVDHMPHLVLFTTKIVCLLKGKHLIAVWHEVWGKAYWKKYLGSLGLIAYWIEKISSRLPDIIISVSEHTTRNLHEVLGVTKRVETINNGVDIPNILSNVPASAGADIVFAGRLLSHKNVDVLLEATKIISERNPSVSLFIIGDGAEKADLQKFTKELNIEDNVKFLGFLEDHNEVYRIMHASKVFVLPSTREGFGMVALEANACGLPVITIEHEQNAAKELIVDGENGMVVSLNKYDLAKAIEESLRTKKDRNKYRSYVEKYDWTRIVLKIENVYSSIL